MSRASGVLAALKAVPYFSDDRVRLYCGDALEVLASLPGASVDAVS